MWLTSHVQAGVAERLIAGLTVASQGEELYDFTDTAKNQIINYNPPTQSRPFILLHTVQQSCSPIYLSPFSKTTEYVTKEVKMHKTANNLSHTPYPLSNQLHMNAITPQEENYKNNSCNCMVPHTTS